MNSTANDYCCVPQCNSWAKKTLQNELSFHTFPKENQGKVYFQNKFGEQVVDRRKAWTIKLRVGKPVTKFMKVCSLHFSNEDFHIGKITGREKFLKKTAIPSRNLPQLTREKCAPRFSQTSKRLRSTDLSSTRNDSDEIEESSVSVNDSTIEQSVGHLKKKLRDILTCSLCHKSGSGAFYRLISKDEHTKKWLKSCFSDYDKINFDNDIYICSAHIPNTTIESPKGNIHSNRVFANINKIEQPKITVDNCMSQEEIEIEQHPLEVNQQFMNFKDEVHYSHYNRIEERTPGTRFHNIRYVGEIKEDNIWTIEQARKVFHVADKTINQRATKLKGLKYQLRRLEARYHKLQLLKKYQILEKTYRKRYIADEMEVINTGIKETQTEKDEDK